MTRSLFHTELDHLKQVTIRFSTPYLMPKQALVRRPICFVTTPSYERCCQVLRMLSNFVGQERFLNGVSIYLKKHLYGNTVTKDLWQGISESTGVDVPRIMDNWISKASMKVQPTHFILTCLASDRFPRPHCHREREWHPCSPGSFPGVRTCRRKGQRDYLDRAFGSADSY